MVLKHKLIPAAAVLAAALSMPGFASPVHAEDSGARQVQSSLDEGSLAAMQNETTSVRHKVGNASEQALAGSGVEMYETAQAMHEKGFFVFCMSLIMSLVVMLAVFSLFALQGRSRQH